MIIYFLAGVVIAYALAGPIGAAVAACVMALLMPGE